MICRGQLDLPKHAGPQLTGCVVINTLLLYYLRRDENEGMTYRSDGCRDRPGRLWVRHSTLVFSQLAFTPSLNAFSAMSLTVCAAAIYISAPVAG